MTMELNIRTEMPNHIGCISMAHFLLFFFLVYSSKALGDLNKMIRSFSFRQKCTFRYNITSTVFINSNCMLINVNYIRTSWKYCSKKKEKMKQLDSLLLYHIPRRRKIPVNLIIGSVSASIKYVCVCVYARLKEGEISESR